MGPRSFFFRLGGLWLVTFTVLGVPIAGASFNLSKYEHIMMCELLKKGHMEAERKIGRGVKSFQVRFHPQFKSRCFFIIRDDESVDYFSFRKCVDNILPLPENMQIKHDVNKALHGKGGGFGRGRSNRVRGRK